MGVRLMLVLVMVTACALAERAAGGRRGGIIISEKTPGNILLLRCLPACQSPSKPRVPKKKSTSLRTIACK